MKWIIQMYNFKTKTDAIKLKENLYQNKKIKTVLEIIGCGNISYNALKKYWTCSNIDGDNPSAIIVKNNPYIGVINYTRKFRTNADIIDLIQYNRNCKFEKAVDLLKEVLAGSVEKQNHMEMGIDATDTEAENHASEMEEVQSVLSEDTLQQYEPILHIDWYKDGIMPWARDRFDIRYDYRGKRVIIPIRDYQTGKLHAINARTTQDDCELFGISKYCITKGYLKHKNVYGLWENRTAIQDAGYAVIYEAERSVLRRYSLNDPTGVALQGHALSDKQADILTDLKVDLIVSMDTDICVDEVRSICHKLKKYIEAKGTSAKVYYTLDEHGLMGKKESLADQPSKIYNQIFSERILFDQEEERKYYESLEVRKA